MPVKRPERLKLAPESAVRKAHLSVGKGMQPEPGCARVSIWVLVEIMEYLCRRSLRAAVTAALEAHKLYRTGRIRLMPSDLLEKGRVTVVAPSDIFPVRKGSG